MAKIGTAHVEIKPVLNEEALNQIVERIEKAVEDGVYRALQRSQHKSAVRLYVDNPRNAESLGPQ